MLAMRRARLEQMRFSISPPLPLPLFKWALRLNPMLFFYCPDRVRPNQSVGLSAPRPALEKRGEFISAAACASGRTPFGLGFWTARPGKKKPLSLVQLHTTARVFQTCAEQ